MSQKSPCSHTKLKKVSKTVRQLVKSYNGVLRVGKSSQSDIKYNKKNV